MSKALKEAIERNDAEAVRKALKTVKDLERKLPKADPPLDYACALGADQAIAPLLEAGATVEKFGRPIRAAIDKGHLSVIRAMGATKKIPSEAASFPLFYAAKDGKTDSVRALLEAFPHPPAVRDTFYWAAMASHVDVIKLLVEHGVDVDRLGLAELHSVAAAGYPRAIQLLLDIGADPNKRDSISRTPLMRMAYEYRRLQESIISLRKKLHEASSDEERAKWTARIAEAPDGIASARLLLARGADASQTDSGGNDAIMYHQYDCLWSGHENEVDPEFVQLLKSAGATGDEAGLALIKALRANDVNAVKQAIADGADMNRSVSPDRNTPLMFCKSADAMKLLLDAGADPNKPSETWTPLIVHAGDLDRVKMLLAAGADLHALAPLHSKDSPLINVYFTADIGNHAEVRKYLKSLGAGQPKRPDWKPIEPGIGLRENFSEIVIKGDTASVAGGLAKMIGGTAQLDAYGKQFTPGKRAFVVVRIKGMNWCNVFPVVPRPTRSRKAVDKLCNEMAKACNSDVLYVEYSDASDCALFVRYLPDGTSHEADTGSKKKEGTEEFDELAAAEKLAVAQFSPGGDDKMVDVDFAEYPADAFDGAAFASA